MGQNTNFTVHTAVFSQKLSLLLRGSRNFCCHPAVNSHLFYSISRIFPANTRENTTRKFPFRSLTWTWVRAGCLLDSPSVPDLHIISGLTKTFHILFNTIPHCPSQTGQVARRGKSGQKFHNPWGDTGSWYRVFMSRCPSCHQPVLKTFTGPHCFINHQQTSEGRDIASFYIGWGQVSLSLSA